MNYITGIHSNPLILAYYLPQFHPFKENDEWWGKGFTEWTNVGKAKPLFRGHEQPKVPADLGYYDLRLPIVREQQVKLAREAGVSGFCYWHYWFGGKGRQLMNSIIDEVHATGKPDFPFCLGWANESWKAKQWRQDGAGDKILMEQRYEGELDYRLHYEYVRELFKDKRYVYIDSKPFFLIYKPNQFKDIKNFINLWNTWIKADGIAEGIYFVANMDHSEDIDSFLNEGFNAVTPTFWERTELYFHQKSKFRFLLHKIQSKIIRPSRINYKKVSKYFFSDKLDKKENVIPFILPCWDHTPRSGKRGRILSGSTPSLFQKHVEISLNGIQDKKNKVLMLKSWNEWAEGNYMEPDLKWGKEYIKSLNEMLQKYLSEHETK